MKDFIFEIGAEEIPAGYIVPALNGMSSLITSKLTKSRVTYGEVLTMGAPRRLTLMIKDVAEKQESVTSEETGPPKKVAFDENGSPKIPAIKFAEKFGKSVEDIYVKETNKGEYLCIKNEQIGKETISVLQNILPEIITSIPFPKTMKWASLTKTFTRPVHSLMALFGDDIIEFQWENIKSGRTTNGHFFMNPEKIEITSPSTYKSQLEEANVFVNIDDRKSKIKEQIDQIAKNLGGKILEDDELVDINTNLIENPVATAGDFNPNYLEVPREILITAMREHQKYFAVVDESNDLMPHFIAINNTRAKDLDLVKKGHERVLNARLSDAKFFFQVDVKDKMDDWVNKLEKVLFQNKLGSMYEKTKRIKKIAEFICDEIDNSEVKIHASRAAWLCKADLVCQVVNEFPKLQGIMGRAYAKIANESIDAALAIEEHYRPIYSGAALPESLAGSIVAIADKIDSICGCFGVGLKPTGAADPYALRRQGIGIIQIMLKQNFSFSFEELIQKSLVFFGNKITEDTNDAQSNILEFFKNRMMQMLVEEGFSKDIVSAILSVPMNNVPNIWNRTKALENLKKSSDFEPLAISFKRVGNIIKKSSDTVERKVDSSLFEKDCEKQLVEAAQEVENKVNNLLSMGDLDKALMEIASLRPLVDTFFDDVLVMADDENVRKNRFAILKKVGKIFENFADFSKISA